MPLIWPNTIMTSFPPPRTWVAHPKNPESMLFHPWQIRGRRISNYLPWLLVAYLHMALWTNQHLASICHKIGYKAGLVAFSLK